MRRWAVAPVVALMVAGCGSASVAELPPPAGPATAPPATEPPGGRVIRVGSAADGIAALAGGRVAVGLRRPPSLALVDVRTGRVARTLRLPAATRPATAGGGEAVLAPTGPAGRLLRVRASDGRVLADVRVVGEPRAAAAGGGGAFVVDPGASTLSAVAGRRVARIVGTPAAPTAVATTADGRLVAVLAGRARVLALYDAATLRRLGTAPAGVGPTNVAVLGDHAYVSDTRGYSVLKYRLRPHLRFERRISVRGGPYAIATDPVRDRLWVTLTAWNELVEIRIERPRIVRRWATIRQPDSVALDPVTGDLYVAGGRSGLLQVVDP